MRQLHHAGFLQDFQDALLAAVHAYVTAEHQFLQPLAGYLLDLCLMEYTMLAFSPPMLAAATVLLARVVIGHLKIIKPGVKERRRRAAVWPAQLAEASGFSATQLATCTHRVFELAQQAEQTDSGAVVVVVARYEQDKMHNVADLPLPSALDEQVFDPDAQCQYWFPVQALGDLPVCRAAEVVS